MEKIHIFTDSSADIPPEKVERYGIEVLPITITYQGKTLREYYDFTSEEYMQMLINSTEIPTTAMIAPNVFLDSYRRASARGCTHAFGIVINGNGSGTFQAACLARDMFYEEAGENTMKIEVLDSAGYTYMYGREIVQAVQMREQGETFDAIVSLARSRLNRVEAYLGVYSLKFLKQSGRISGGAAFLGEALGLKPISHVYEGAVTVCDKVRGEKALISAMIKNVAARVEKPETQTALLLYGVVSKERTAELAKRLVDEIGFADVEILPIGAAVLTNSGPEAIAVGYYGASRA